MGPFLKTDRIFGAVVILAALWYIQGAFQIKSSFLSDPVGSKTFPILLGITAIICGLIFIFRPDEFDGSEREFGQQIVQVLGAGAVFIVAEIFFGRDLDIIAWPIMLIGAAVMLRFWPIGAATLTMICFAMSLKPLGFLIPTAVAAAVLSWQIMPRPLQAVLTGLGLSIGLFLIFKYALGLGLQPFPKAWLG